MVKPNILFYLLLLLAMEAFSQEMKESIDIKFHGFVRADAALDNRVNLESREGFFIFYPLAPQIDKNGKDINARTNFNQWAMTTRIRGELNGPELLKAKSFALVEGDFTGPSNTENNAFRMRHAYIRLDWKNSRLLTGQYWTPMDVPEALPRVLALNTGAPFHSFARAPQIRFEQNLGRFTMVGVAYSQRDYISPGPQGSLPDYVRYGVIPNLQYQLQYKWNNNLAMIGINYKRLSPRLKTDSLLYTEESISSLAAIATLKIETKPVSIRMQGVFGQNLSDHLLLGGYAVQTEDTLTNIRTYINLNVASVWVDLMTNTTKWQAGIFAGFTKNMGTNALASNRFYGRGDGIDYVYRFSPRIQLNALPLQFIAEMEYTTVAYGKHDAYYQFETSSPVSNLRWQVAAVYNF